MFFSSNSLVIKLYKAMNLIWELKKSQLTSAHHILYRTQNQTTYYNLKLQKIFWNIKCLYN